MVSEVSTPTQLALSLLGLRRGVRPWQRKLSPVTAASNDHLPVLPHYTQQPLLHIQDPHCSPFHAGMDARDLHFFLHFCQVCLQFAQTKPTPLGLTLFVSVSCLHCYGQWNLNFIFCLLMTRAEKCSCLWHYSLDLGVFSSVRFVRFFMCEIICLQKEVVLHFSFQLLC